MQYWIIYLLKMTACSAILLLYYAAILRNRAFNRYNRFYLLSAVLFSFIVPLIHLPTFLQGSGHEAPSYIETLRAIQINPFTYQNNEWITKISTGLIQYCYLTISLLIFVSLIISVLKIYRMRKRYPRTLSGNIRIYQTNEPNTPFTFLKNIFWNDRLSIDSERGRQILRHEWLHAAQGHTYDLIFMKIAIAIAWINPFLYIIRKELVAVHEFLADDFATRKCDRHAYAECLVEQAIQQKNNIPVAHHFFHSPFKRRINMLLLQSTPNRLSYWRKFLILPVVAGIFLTFTVSAQQSASDKKSDILIGVKEQDHDSGYPGGYKAWTDFLIKTLHYPEAAVKEKIEGNVVLQFTVEADGTVSDVEAISGPMNGGLREEAIRVMKASGKWLPAVKDDKRVASVKKQPFVFRLSEKQNKIDVQTKALP